MLEPGNVRTHYFERGNRTYASLVDLQEGKGLSIRREPHDIVAAKDLLLVHPIRNSVEKIWSTVLGDLSSGAILPDEQIVSTDICNCVSNRCECSILNIYNMSVEIQWKIKVILTSGLVSNKRLGCLVSYIVDMVIRQVRISVKLGVVRGEENMLTNNISAYRVYKTSQFLQHTRYLG